ncbi:MAG TPA: GNAT family N-acetyltransferase [Halanaerobiales bacterium]|nr:GNAT family N-acetyltransferase [Halanaerobiales bacterium]
MNIRKIKNNFDEKEKVAAMLIKFRRYLASLKNREENMTIKDGVDEIDYYLDKKYPIYTAIEDDQYVGYFILKYDDDAVWLEQFFVKEEYRKQGIGTKLFRKAEAVLEDLGYVNLYNWVHPNNNGMINFLKSQGYDVLNMIEVRKQFDNEELKSKVQVGENKFKYN